MNINIGAQYFTIREFCQSIKDFDESCKKVSDIGYKYVQLSGIGDFAADKIKTILDKYNLKTVCTHRPPQNYIEKLDEEIKYHQTLDCNICGIGCMPAFNAKPETIEEFVNSYKPVVNALKKKNLIFAYHNHAFEFEKIDGKYVFDILVEKMAADNFKYILDVYWLAYAGINPAKFIREHRDNIACVHFKDIRIVQNAPQFAEVGYGNIDWDDVIAACEEAGVIHALVEQDTCDGDPFQSFKMSYDFLKEKGLK